MGHIRLVVTIGAVIFSFGLKAQETENKNEKMSYYEQRAREDAKYEQELNANEAENETAFWDSQQAYEKDLKKRDRKAYRAYMRGKRAAYAEHAAYCDHHHHHSAYFYYYADHYYSSPRYYRSAPSRSSVNTNVRVGTPSVRLRVAGLF